MTEVVGFDGSSKLTPPVLDGETGP